jgi:acetylornithine deacetylase/succinyl-diaminopimelate desuccinylase-like protein
MKPLRAIGFARRHRSRFVAELKEFVRFPTVSSQARHARDFKNCAAWLTAHLKSIGLDQVRVVPTRFHPIVYAASRHVSGRPTILIYGHYDVQPVEPLDQWRHPPFDPIVKNERLYGRGASDDKGQLFAHVKALESYLKTDRALPVNVKCLFEGDEETGSSGLESFVESNKSALRAHAAVMSDTRMLGERQPAIGYAQRGTVRFELEVTGPKHDLHSGNFGGAVLNPLQSLCEILATLHDHADRVAIPGFYDRVREWSQRERDYMARVGPKDASILRDGGVEQGWGEDEFSVYERVTIRPALTLNGLGSGYQGEGIKTVIPARALAKLSIRIVPDQNPTEIQRLLRAHIGRVAPQGVRVSLRALGASSPIVINRKHPALEAAAFAYEKGFGAKPVYLRSGGSVPAAGVFQKALGIPTALMGFALPDDRIHAPNESFHLPTFFRGVETCIWFLQAAARLPIHAASRATQKEGVI